MPNFPQMNEDDEFQKRAINPSPKSEINVWMIQTEGRASFMVSATRACPKCGAELPGDALEGLCPKCVGQLALATPPLTPSESSNALTTPLREKPGNCIGRYKL